MNQIADIDEKMIRREKPEDLVIALAEAKVWLINCQLCFVAEYLMDALQVSTYASLVIS